MTKIAWHTWEPGITDNNSLTSSGGAQWMNYLFEELSSAGHEIYWVTNEPFEHKILKTVSYFEAAKTCDVLFAPWRWAMPLYPARQVLYENQMLLLEHFYKADKRVMIHDQDHKITVFDENYLMNIGAEIYEPSFFPRDGVKTLHFPQNLRNVDQSGHVSVDFVYVGNNYERFDLVIRLLGGRWPIGYYCQIWGNWLEPSQGRESPEEVKFLLPSMMFMGRCPQEKVLETLSKAKTTIHFCKESYSRHGFITYRWAEAAAAGVIPMIPAGFRLPSLWFEMFYDCGLFVDSPEEVQSIIDQYENIYPEAMRISRNLVRRYMTVDKWLEILK